MIRDGLYHQLVFMPPELLKKLPKRVDNVAYCPHAIEKIIERKILYPPAHIVNCSIPEVEVIEGQITKAIYKVDYTKHMDMCLVFHIKNNKPHIVRTLWVNNKVDRVMIDRGRYVHPE